MTTTTTVVVVSKADQSTRQLVPELAVQELVWVYLPLVQLLSCQRPVQKHEMSVVHTHAGYNCSCYVIMEITCQSLTYSLTT